MTKKFKLLKDLPTIKAGTILTYNSKENPSWSQIYNSTLIEYTNVISELLQDIKDDKEWLKEIKERPVLKYDNGAIMEAPEEGTYVYNIFESCINGFTWNSGQNYTRNMKDHLALRNIFLTQKEAQNYLKVLQTQNRLLKKIKEIDAENNWVADWGDGRQIKYYLCWDCHNNIKEFATSSWIRSDTVYISRQTKDYMISDAVSDKEFKLFLGIKD